MDLLEVSFGIIERQAIHSGTFRNVRDLTAKIRAFINGWSARAQPFVWTKNAAQILENATQRSTTSVRELSGKARPLHMVTGEYLCRWCGGEIGSREDVNDRNHTCCHRLHRRRSAVARWEVRVR